MICTLEYFVCLGMEVVGDEFHPPPYRRGNSIDYLNNHGLRKWRAAYGVVRPMAAYLAWLRIERRAEQRAVTTKHLFWALHWMKAYSTEDNACRMLKTSAKTLRQKVRVVIKLLSRAMASEVSWRPPIFLKVAFLTNLFFATVLYGIGEMVPSSKWVWRRGDLHDHGRWHRLSHSGAETRGWRERCGQKVVFS